MGGSKGGWRFAGTGVSQVRERERADDVFAGKTGEHKEEKRRERSP